MVWQHSNVSFDIRKNTIRCHTGGHNSFTVQIKLKCHKKIQRGWFIISVMIKLKWRPLTILKTSNKSLRSNIFWYVKVCIFWRCIQYTVYWDKTQILKKFPLDKINGTKNALFFFREHQLITVLLLICDSSISWSTRFVSVKLCLRFSVFDSVSFLLKFIFLFNKILGHFDFKTS